MEAQPEMKETVHFRVLPMFVTIVTAFGLRSNQVARAPNATDQRRRPARGVRGGPKPDVVKLLQRRANWVSCRDVALLQCC